MNYRIENGKYVYRYWHEGKYKRVPRNSYTQPKDEEEAKKLKEKLQLKYEGVSQRRLELMKWRSIGEFKSLFKKFDQQRKEDAPNAWESRKVFFDYGMYYFVSKRKILNISDWRYEFLDFKRYLEHECFSIRKDKLLSYSSKNHVINEVNCFLRFLAQMGKAEVMPKIPLFPEHKLDNIRGVESLVSEVEFHTIFNFLKDRNQASADFYKLLRHTGMRLNELRGVTLNDVKKGDPPHESLKQLFKASFPQPILGYIILSKQPVGREGLKMKFKPLKSKKKINEKNTRYVPILDKDVFNILVRYIKAQKELMLARKYGDNPGDYCLFFDLDKNKVSNDLRAVYKKCDYEFKSLHCLRHTRATELSRADFSQQLPKLILGHTSKTTDRYVHLNEEIYRETVNSKTSFDDFDYL